MKTCNNNLLRLPALIAGLGLMQPGQVTAQTFTTLHSFTAVYYNSAVGNITNRDGTTPYAGLLLSGNTLYGTAKAGGSSGAGSVFAVNTDGTGFTNLYSFTGGSDGASPFAGLVLSGNTLYGTAESGGDSGVGTVFKLSTNGTGFTNLHSFSYGGDGARPNAGLTLAGDILYGTASDGGSSYNGTVFAINTDGTGFTNLHSFDFSDGSFPYAGVILSGNTLYGTASAGGKSGRGAVFAISTDGTGFTNLHSFVGYPIDGDRPQAGLILAGNILYGTASTGGSSASGTVFAINTNGTGYTNIHRFNGSDGGNPFAGLIHSGNALYGTAAAGGSSGRGTVFAVNTDGTGFTNLHSFTATDPSTGTNSDGANPSAGLILSGNTLYGTAVNGGSSGKGTVFRLSLGPVSAPRLTLAPDGSSGYLIRAQGNPNFTCRLQRAANVTGPWDTIDTQTAPASGLIEFHDTSPLPGQAFYRTVQP